jgi:hypothetical protein
MGTPTYDYIAGLAGKVAWWPLDDADPTNEEVGGLDLTMLNTPTHGVDMGFVAGDTGTFFDEASTEGASVAHNAAFDPGTSDWSVAFWAIIPTSDGTTRYVVAHDGNGSAGTWAVRHVSGNATMVFTAVTGNTAFTANSTVKFFVINCDRDANKIMYIDGVAGNSSSISADQTSQAFNGTLYLARRQTTGHGSVTLAHVVLRTQLWTTQEMTDAMASRLDSGASAAATPPSSLRSLGSLVSL